MRFFVSKKCVSLVKTIIGIRNKRKNDAFKKFKSQAESFGKGTNSNDNDEKNE
jgi:hypothetical protein